MTFDIGNATFSGSVTFDWFRRRTCLWVASLTTVTFLETQRYKIVTTNSSESVQLVKETTSNITFEMAADVGMPLF